MRPRLRPRKANPGPTGGRATSSQVLSTLPRAVSKRPEVSLRIVVADNDAAALELAVTDLDLEGHEIVAAVTNGADAIAAVRLHHPDVLVVDHRMPPGPFGLDVLRTLAGQGVTTRVVVYSNYQDADVVAEVKRLGGRFLPKGDLHRLRRAVLGG